MVDRCRKSCQRNRGMLELVLGSIRLGQELRLHAGC